MLHVCLKMLIYKQPRELFKWRKSLYWLANEPNSVHKVPVNHYQYFVSASAYLSYGIKQADAVRRAQEDWKRRAATSEEEHLATNETRCCQQISVC